MTDWFTHHEDGSLRFELATLGACDLSVLRLGERWYWQVRCDGCDVAEGLAASMDNAKRAAAEAALRSDASDHSVDRWY